jgi:hypothetical protein
VFNTHEALLDHVLVTAREIAAKQEKRETNFLELSPLRQGL